MSNHPHHSFALELRLLGQRFASAWGLVSGRQKRALGLAAILMAVAAATNSIIAIALGRMVDAVAAGGGAARPARAIYALAAGCLGIIAAAFVVREVLTVCRRCLVENTCTRLNRDMSLKLIAHLLKANLELLSQSRIGALHGRINRSVDGLVRFVRVSFLDFLPALFTGLIALIVATSQNALLGMMMFGAIPIAVFLTVRQIVSQKGVRLALMRDCEEIDSAIVEQLMGIEYVRAANSHGLEIERLGSAFDKRRAREVWHHFQMSLYGCAKSLNEGAFHILVLGVAIYLAVHGAISSGDVLVFSVLFLNVMAPLAEVHRVLDEGHEASLRVADLVEMLGEPEDPSFHTTVANEPRRVAGEPIIEMGDLVVHYRAPDGNLVKALDGVTLSVRHGETIGVAGRSGSGKSTWLKVLLRLAHPHQGHVSLCGIPLEQVARETIGQLIGYVGQQPFIFAGTIADNIAYANDRATPAEIQRAAELANLHDEIMQMPGAYKAPIAERGQNLSGGQRQRLAIARVLVKQPPILILDEATSALDNLSERLVQNSLGVRDPDRTTILAAHRLTTLRDADRIVVFDEGRIVEVGSYGALLQSGGIFAALVTSAEKSVADPAAVQNGWAAALKSTV